MRLYSRRHDGEGGVGRRTCRCRQEQDANKKGADGKKDLKTAIGKRGMIDAATLSNQKIYR